MSKMQSKATKQANAERAAERAAAIRQEQERREKQRRALWVSVSVLAVLAVIVAIAVAVQSSRDTTGQATTPPSGAVDTYALPMGQAAPVTVTVYEDFMCPYCGLFENASRDVLKEYAASGDVQVRYHVVSFLDDASSTDYSTRAANALAVVLDESGPEVAVKFHDLLFENQPAEGTAGLSDEQLVDLAVQAGADEQSVTGPIQSLKFEQWVVNSTDEWSSRGFNGTPTVTVNGEKVEFQSAEDLVANMQQMVESALAE